MKLKHSSLFLMLAVLLACCLAAPAAADETDESRQPLIASTFILDSLSTTIQSNINEKQYDLVEYDIQSYKKELSALQNLIDEAGYGGAVSLEQKTDEYNTLVMRYALARGFANIDGLVSALQFMNEKEFGKADELIASFKTGNAAAETSVAKLITDATPDAAPFLSNVTQLGDDTRELKIRVFQKSELQKQLDTDPENERIREGIKAANAEVGRAAEKFRNTSASVAWTAQKYGKQANILVTGNSLALGFYEEETKVNETLPPEVPTGNETVLPEEGGSIYPYYPAAGIVILILIAGIFVYLRKRKDNTDAALPETVPAVPPAEMQAPAVTIPKPETVLTGRETAGECFDYVADVLASRFGIENARSLSPRQLLQCAGDASPELREFVALYEKIHYAESAVPEDLATLNVLAGRIRDRYL